LHQGPKTSSAEWSIDRLLATSLDGRMNLMEAKLGNNLTIKSLSFECITEKYRRPSLAGERELTTSSTLTSRMSFWTCKTKEKPCRTKTGLWNNISMTSKDILINLPELLYAELMISGLNVKRDTLLISGVNCVNSEACRKTPVTCFKTKSADCS
jgi:hypothetical protein